MFPLIRTFYNRYKSNQKPKFSHPFEESSVEMRVYPWDIDIFMELNNGRFLTLMDIGRMDVGIRLNLYSSLAQRGWGLMVGAVSGRFRHRFRPFEKFTLHSRLTHFDERWFYFHQWFVGSTGKIHASFLVRTAVISKKGLVPTADVVEELKFEPELIAKDNVPSEWLKQWAVSDAYHKVVMEEELVS